MEERSLCMREVMGSIPIISTNKSGGRSSNGRAFAKQVKGRRIDTFRLQLSVGDKGLGIAQLEEHLHGKQKVSSSILLLGTIIFYK